MDMNLSDKPISMQNELVKMVRRYQNGESFRDIMRTANVKERDFCWKLYSESIEVREDYVQDMIDRVSGRKKAEKKTVSADAAMRAYWERTNKDHVVKMRYR